ncbi:MAG: DUF72 domain-containing protein [Candidatus Thermoplasmatota archaeon]|nr:DUF72 domain-containing protein [Candidatus Thermoplasmatota archaeon]
MMRIGCSGWSYPEWCPSFYPTRNTDFLRYYSRKFSTVEINSTFYSIPEVKSVRSWINSVSWRKDFLFSVKLPASISHESVLDDLQLALEKTTSFETQILSEFQSRGKLGMVLIQLPPAAGKNSRDQILRFLSSISATRFRYALELRNPGIMEDRKFASEVVELGISLVATDSPLERLDGSQDAEEIWYFRLHGRNHEAWASHLGKNEKYDYRYDHEELDKINEKIKAISPATGDAFVYFNNHPHGNAPLNATELMAMTGNLTDPQRTLTD